jgi:hypothetical protein
MDGRARRRGVRGVPWLVRRRGKWTEEAVGIFEELAKAAPAMFVREDGVEGEVSAYKEASPRDSEEGATYEDVVGVVEAAAVGACGVVRGGGAVTKGVVPLK